MREVERGSEPAVAARDPRSASPTTAVSLPKRVLFVFGSLERAGAQLRTLEICQELRRRHPMQFDFCILGLGPVELEDEVSSIGGSVHLVSIRSPRFLWEFSSLLRNGRYEVVNSEPTLLSGLVMLMSAKRRVPIRIAALRVSLGDEGRLTSSSPLARRALSSAWFVWLMRKLIRRYATHVVAVSHSVMDSLLPPRWRSGCDCRVIYNGIPLSPFRAAPDGRRLRTELGWPPESRILVNVARLSPQKNHRVILETTRLVHESDGSVRLLLVGTGRLHEEVDRLVDYYGLRDICAMVGSRTDVPRLLLDSDVFFFPSLWEGLPGAVLEALAAGLPVVASDIPPIREVAPYFPSSIFTAPPDDVQGHAEHIGIALKVPRDRNASLARLAASPFVLDQVVSDYAALYGLGTPRHRPSPATAASRDG